MPLPFLPFVFREVNRKLIIDAALSYISSKFRLHRSPPQFQSLDDRIVSYNPVNANSLEIVLCSRTAKSEKSSTAFLAYFVLT